MSTQFRPFAGISIGFRCSESPRNPGGTFFFLIYLGLAVDNGLMVKRYTGRTSEFEKISHQWNHSLAAAAGDPFLTTGLARAWESLKSLGFARSCFHRRTLVDG